MSIRVLCPGCERVLILEGDFAGKKWLCNCGQFVDVPTSVDRVAEVGSSPESTAAYAGFWQRLAAFLVDRCVAEFAVLFGAGFLASMIGMESETGGIYLLLRPVPLWLYFSLQESSRAQATVGKQLFKIKVTDLHKGRISFLRASGRHFGKVLSGILLGIGFIMAAFTPRKQALHDMMAGCLVVSRYYS